MIALAAYALSGCLAVGATVVRGGTVGIGDALAPI